MKVLTSIERRAALLAAALWLCAATPAAAFPVYFGGPGGYGISASSASSAVTAGFALVDAPLFPADAFGISIPAPDVLSFHIQSHPSTSTPTTAQSRWSVTNGGESDLTDAWLVFYRPTDYPGASTGIDLQAGGRWALARAQVGSTTYYYPAVFLGDLDSNQLVTFLMNHVVGVPLTQSGTTFILPQYQVGIMQGVPVPEASTLGLLLAGLTCALALRRGKV